MRRRTDLRPVSGGRESSRSGRCWPAFPQGEQLTPYARVMHERWATTTAEQTVRLRRAEDQRAADILGAKPVHLEFLDAIYRTTADGEALYGDPVGRAAAPGG